MSPQRLHLEVADARPHQRGIARGERLREQLPACLSVYLRLFETLGLGEGEARTAALRVADVVAGWRPQLLDEIEGIAVGAGLDVWQVMTLNARTEILSQATSSGPGECSTIAYRPEGGSAFGIQTWDWHQEVDPYWHTHRVVGTRYDHVGLTEHGVLGKIGMNSAGLGVHFNILGHRDDVPTGVPVHLLSAAILAEAGTVDEAVELLHSAPIATSGALTLVATDAAVCAELSPGRVTLLQPMDGFAAHTNHFLDPVNAQREKRWLYEPDSQQRLELIESRLRDYPRPTKVDDLVDYLYSEPGQPQLCCVPAPDAVFGDRWATLATVLLEPEHRRARVLAGTPADARRGGWITLDATQSLGAVP
jgi:predicted choloylglycine hydrolase